MAVPTAYGYQFGTIFSSAASLDAALGQQLGDYAVLSDGTILQLLQASGSIGANAACVSTVVSTGTPYIVAASSAALQGVYAVNDRSGATGLVQRGATDFSGTALTTGQVAWFTVQGYCKPNVAASQTAAATALLATTTTAGRLTIGTIGTDPLSPAVILLSTTTTAAPALARKF
jgi:hypothetical protein